MTSWSVSLSSHIYLYLYIQIFYGVISSVELFQENGVLASIDDQLKIQSRGFCGFIV